MKVLYVHHGGRRGGAPLSLFLLLKGLPPGSVDPVVLLPRGEVAEWYEAAGIEVIRAPISQVQHSMGAAYTGKRVGIVLVRELPLLVPHLRALDAAISRLQPDIVHLNEASLTPAAWLARKRGVPVVWHVRSTLHPKGELRRRWKRRAVARADAVITIDSDVNRSYGEPPNAVEIFNGVDLEAHTPAPDPAMRERIAPGFSGVLVGMLNQLYPQKGIYDLLDAHAILARRRPDLRVGVAFVGESPRSAEWFKTPWGKLSRRFGVIDHRAELQRRASSLGVSDRTFFPGYVQEAARVYRAVDIVAFPSHLAALGRPALEAAACGRPLVAAVKAHGAGIVVPDRTGVLVAPHDVNALADALERLAADESLRARLGDDARRRAQRFDHVGQATKVLRVYERVVAGQPVDPAAVGGGDGG